MKKYYVPFLLALAACAVLITACSEDDESARPSISLSETSVTASAGDEITIDLDISTAAGFKSLVVSKKWDGVVEDEETIDTAPTSYVYTVEEEDADHVVTLNFKVTDKDNRTAQKELVIIVELTARQILLKYNWRLSEEIRKATNANDINSDYDDDVYRFNADGTYNKSIGAKVDDFGDLVNSYCYYNLNDNTLRLLMSRRDHWNNVNVVDTLDIVVVDETKFNADITYYGLDVFNTGEEEVPYEEVEEYQKRFVAVPKVASFDPYQAGATDDGGPGDCVPLTFENGRKKKKN